MMSLTDFLAQLPGVQPIKARKLILSAGLLSKEQRADIYNRDRGAFDLVQLVGPDAAAAILSAYRAGQLPLAPGRKIAAASDAERYVESESARREADERTRRARAFDDPSLIVETDLEDHYFIDGVFLKHVGKGSKSMTLAGITVHKTLSGYKSNSGKSTGWRVRFDWVSSDGKPRRSEVAPPEASNRRNDPERDWGLYD
jgi:hypothetical protein